MDTMTVNEPKLDKDAINLFEVGCLVNLKIKMWSGRKMLTRADLMRVGQIEQRARKALERWSVPFGIANAHFVPATMLPTVEQQIADLKEEFFVRVDSFISRFDDLVGKVKDAHPDFWEKCLKGNYPANPKSLRSRFQFDWYTFKIAGMGSIEETSVHEIVAGQKVRNERENELRCQMKEEVSGFVEEYVTSMRDETVRFCDLMTARINGKPFGDETDSKKLTPKSISCFRNYVDRFRSMNIFGDGEVEKMLSEFRDTFLDSGIAPQDFESANIKTSVSKALEAIRNKAAAEGESGSKFIGELRRKVTL